ncbi:hypothetical protein ACFT0G_03125 [Streptomyces sp. NPDC057020]|uniref:hypothetical protein n=1 Tax=unclassified Streptomyces TaxID=2593676 RepID=UPI00362DE085
MTPGLTQPNTARNRSEWSPTWPPGQSHTLPPVTVISTPRDEQDFMRLAFQAHQPHTGRITVHPTPLAGSGPYLAHDLIRALGKHLPLPAADQDLPTWASHTDPSWRIAAAWITTLGINRLTVCRAHRLTSSHWGQLLALAARTGIRLTLLCNGPTPPKTLSLLDTIEHKTIDTQRDAAAHWRPPKPRRQPAGYPWWQHRAPFPPQADELQFLMPPQPSQPATVYFQPTSLPPATTPPLPAPGPHQDPFHPHHTAIADRIHTRIAHPVHASCAALATLTGYNSRQIKALHTHAGSGPPPLPAWTRILIDAACQLAALRGHPDAPNPLSVPSWEHEEIDQALHACGLLPTLPNRRHRPPLTPASRTKTIRQMRGLPNP